MSSGNSNSSQARSDDPVMGDRTGDRVGMLTVLGPEENTRNGKPAWLCVCACSREVVVTGANLDRTTSCGCLPKKKRGPREFGRKLNQAELHVYSQVIPGAPAHLYNALATVRMHAPHLIAPGLLRQLMEAEGNADVYAKASAGSRALWQEIEAELAKKNQRRVNGL